MNFHTIFLILRALKLLQFNYYRLHVNLMRKYYLQIINEKSYKIYQNIHILTRFPMMYHTKLYVKRLVNKSF